MRAIRNGLMIMFLSTLLFWVTDASGQIFGGNPPSIRWNQLNTDTARVIFPVGLEQQAMAVQRIVHQLASITQPTIGGTTRKIDIVLQNQTTISNGYVALGPYRSEFYLTPEQNSFELGSLPWYKMLALHEYRHVQQNNNFRKGLSRLFYILFGEEGQALATSLAIPNWFWEGDAVFQETMLSRQGRGRIPFFFNDYRSIWAAGKDYSWMKLRNGSLRDLTPDHYRLGYIMVAYGREVYGDSVWGRITDDAARFRGLFYPFQRSIKKYTGLSFPEYRQNAFNYFKKQMEENTGSAGNMMAGKEEHFVADEEFPQWIGNHQLVYLRSSYKKIPAFFLRDTRTNTDRRIRVKDISIDRYFSARNGQIVYSGYREDPRWKWKNFGVIVKLDIAARKQQVLTTGTKYFSPDISEDGQKIVAVELTPSGKNNIHLLNGMTGKMIHTMPNPRQFQFTFPKFFGENKIVSAVRNGIGEMALGLFDLNTGNPQWLTAFSMNTIAFPQVNGDTICFTRSSGDREKIYAWINGKLFEFMPSLDNRATGCYQLTVTDGQAAYTTFTATGYRLLNAPATFRLTTDVIPHSSDTVYPLEALRNTHNLVADTGNRVFPVSRYPASFRIFHFRSWRPFISDPEYSYSAVSENILNTLQSELYVTYNRNERYKQLGATIAYAGWYPVLSGGASFTFDRSGARANQLISWNELNANVGVSVPLSVVHGTYTTRITPSVKLNTQQVYYTGASKNAFEDLRFNFGEMNLSFVNQQSQAIQQIYPRFAQTFSIRYRTVIDKYEAKQLLMTGSVYLPGFSGNHSLVIQGAYQRRDTMQQYLFSNGFPEARGYNNIDFPRMWKVGVNYHFPIAYPDQGFGNIVYLLRVRGNVFYDYSEAKSLRTGQIRNFNSTGLELYADTKWWNELPVSLGIRYSRLLDPDLTGRSHNRFELVLPINLLSR